MKDLVLRSLGAVKAALAAKKLESQVEEEGLVADIAVLQRHSSLTERLASAQIGFSAMASILEERYGGDCISVLAQQLSVDSTRLELLSSQLAAIESVKRNLPRIISEFRKCTVGACQSDLTLFEGEYAAILKKHAAIA
jgi:hypothetical protein